MRNVGISVEQADALSHRVDLLVLTYAQYPYGVDLAAADLLGLRREDMPGVGHHLLVSGRSVIGAESVLFVGVPSLESFGYAEIREFGSRALSLAALLRPRARTLSMTMHGPGYGLDEVEAFESQIAGVNEAIEARQMPPTLEQVQIVERDARRVQRTRAVLANLIPDSRLRTNRPPDGEGMSSPKARHLKSVGYDAQDKMRAFVAMPFADEFEDVFHFGIAAPIREAGMLCERMDRLAFTGDVVAERTKRIAFSRLVVADLTTNNPNVYLEVGYAWGRDVPTLLLCRDSHQMQFNVQSHRCLRYKNIRDLAGQLNSTLPELLEAGPGRTGKPSGISRMTDAG